MILCFDGGERELQGTIAFRIESNPGSIYDGFSVVGVEDYNTEALKALDAYRQYMAQDSYAGRLYFIYLNDDRIPELIIDGVDAATGSVVLTYFKGKVESCTLDRGDFEYYEKQNIIDNDTGNMGYFYCSIIQIQNGNFYEIATGNISMKDMYLDVDDWDFEDDSQWNFTWNGETVSAKEYWSNREEILPIEGGVNNPSWDIGIDVGSYSAEYGDAINQAYLELLERWDNR